MKIVITGGTGLIGTHLQDKLISKGYEITIFSRNKKSSDKKGLSYAQWDIDKGLIDVNAVCSADYIIHLAGANIADKRWSDQQKKIIIDSRVQTANLLFKTLKENNHCVKGFVSASGADCYGLETTDKVYKETDAYGDDFLAEVCKHWEKSALQFNTIGIPTTCLRTGVVFAKEKSALQKIVTPIKIGVGSPLGSGQQIMSYIHVEDLCDMYIHIIENQISGIYNAVAANDSNAQVTKNIAKILNAPLFMPNVPSFILKLLFGEMSLILLEGSAVDNSKIKETGFKFRHPNSSAILNYTLHK
ncbi:TIGR01777 family oxidoreductase [Wenyingzhuangia sp. IMCC45533]